jgi:hypothetical protein
MLNTTHYCGRAIIEIKSLSVSQAIVHGVTCLFEICATRLNYDDDNTCISDVLLMRVKSMINLSFISSFIFPVLCYAARLMFFSTSN